MPLVWIPSLYRDLTNNKDKIEIQGSTIGEVIDNLDLRFPGIKQRLLKNNELRSDISVLVNGEVSFERLRQKIYPNNEIFFVPAISGG